MDRELRITIELLDANGNVMDVRTILAEPDSDSMVGDFESELDEILADLDNE